MKKSNTRKIASALAAFSLVSAMAMPASTIPANADEPAAVVLEDDVLHDEEIVSDDISENESLYNNHAITDGSFINKNTEYKFKYSDGFFETDPVKYDSHLATMSAYMAYASSNETVDNDYSNGEKKVADILGQIGFGNICANEGYHIKPTPDSIGCVIADKNIHTEKGDRRIVSITVRSSKYEAEWASNVTLGREGEAEGFASAANQVAEHFEYFKELYGLEKDLEEGNVIFWIQGFSRGGAAANLSAKRLIDRYQANGNEIYAYCIEAPQGGVAEAENPECDYRTIHNVINENDIVTYAAPSAMGFKRYGIDHYIMNGESDSDNLVKSYNFENNLADNSVLFDVEVQKERMVKQLENMISDETERNSYMPYEITSKKLCIPNMKKIEDAERNQTTSTFLFNTMRNMIGGTPVIGPQSYTKMVISRDTYCDEIEKPLRRLMKFIKADNDLSGIQNDFSIKTLIVNAVSSLPSDVLFETKVVAKGRRGVWGTLKGVFQDMFTKSKNVTITTKLSAQSREKIAEAIVKTMSSNENLMCRFDNYPTDEFDSEDITDGRSAVLSDVSSIVNNVLKGVNDINDVVTLACNIKGIFKNHTFVQAIAWLRSFDSWYDDVYTD